MKKFLIGLIFLTFTFNIFAFTPAEIHSKSVTAILYLEFYEKGGNNCPVGGNGPCSATGFFVEKDGFIMTNNHVVENIDLSTLVATSSSKNTYSNFELRYDKKISKTMNNADIGILKVSEIQENDTFLELASEGKEYLIDEEIYWIGHPDGIQFNFSKGPIKGIKNLDSMEIILFEGVGYGGSSGSPLINNEGKVIGILSAGKTHKNDSVKKEIIGFGRKNLAEALEEAKNNYNSNLQTKSDKQQPEISNDLASLIRELKAYTPPEERRLGNL